MITILLTSLALTLASELLAAFPLGLGSRDGLRTVLLMNLATNPLTVFFVTLARKFWAPGPALLFFAGAEVLVWLAETVLLRVGAGLSRKRAAVCSLVLNGLSCGLGALISYLCS